jgi:hypothetical protein
MRIPTSIRLTEHKKLQPHGSLTMARRWTLDNNVVLPLKIGVACTLLHMFLEIISAGWTSECSVGLNMETGQSRMVGRYQSSSVHQSEYLHSYDWPSTGVLLAYLNTRRWFGGFQGSSLPLHIIMVSGSESVVSRGAPVFSRRCITARNALGYVLWHVYPPFSLF